MATCHALASPRARCFTIAVRRDPRRPYEDPFAFYGVPPLPRLAIRRMRLPLSGLIQRGGFLVYSLVTVGGSRWDLLIYAQSRGGRFPATRATAAQVSSRV